MRESQDSLLFWTKTTNGNTQISQKGMIESEYRIMTLPNITFFDMPVWLKQFYVNNKALTNIIIIIFSH